MEASEWASLSCLKWNHKNSPILNCICLTSPLLQSVRAKPPSAGDFVAGSIGGKGGIRLTFDNVRQLTSVSFPYRNRFTVDSVCQTIYVIENCKIHAAFNLTVHGMGCIREWTLGCLFQNFHLCLRLAVRSCSSITNRDCLTTQMVQKDVKAFRKKERACHPSSISWNFPWTIFSSSSHKQSVVHV